MPDYKALFKRAYLLLQEVAGATYGEDIDFDEINKFIEQTKAAL